MRSGSIRIMLLPSASLKDSVLFHRKNENHSHIRPGYYIILIKTVIQCASDPTTGP